MLSILRLMKLILFRKSIRTCAAVGRVYPFSIRFMIKSVQKALLFRHSRIGIPQKNHTGGFQLGGQNRLSGAGFDAVRESGGNPSSVISHGSIG